MSQTKTDVCHIRWMIRTDMPTVYAIEKASFEFPWTEEEFIRCLRQRDVIGMVAEIDEQVVGFMCYALAKQRLELLSIAVHPEHRWKGIGATMVRKIVSKLAYQRRDRIVVRVRETNLSALNFFKSCGFLATNIERQAYEETSEDMIVMRFRIYNF